MHGRQQLFKSERAVLVGVKTREARGIHPDRFCASDASVAVSIQLREPHANPLGDVPADCAAELATSDDPIPIGVQGSKQSEGSSSDTAEVLRLGLSLGGSNAWPAEQAESDDESDPGHHG